MQEGPIRPILLITAWAVQRRFVFLALQPVAPSTPNPIPITIRGSAHPTLLPHPGHSPGHGSLARRGAQRPSSYDLPVPAAACPGTSGRGQGLNRWGQIQHLQGVNDWPFCVSGESGFIVDLVSFTKLWIRDLERLHLSEAQIRIMLSVVCYPAFGLSLDFRETCSW